MLTLAVSVQALALDANSLEELTQLARAGAPQLALHRMDAEQPDPEKELAEWTAWEQERLQILLHQGLYSKLLQRVDAIPEGVDPRFLGWALSLKADALLELGDTQQARATVRQLLWFHNESITPEQAARWRRQVVRSYVLEDRTEDARLALLRYRQDFGDENPEWRWLNAKVMLRGGHAQSAFDLLQDDTSGQGRFLRLAAQLMRDPQKAPEVEKSAVEMAQQVKEPALQGALWALAASAAQKMNRSWEEITYRERALSLPENKEMTLGLLEVDPDQLWNLYLEVGQQIGNQEQLLLGKDDEWYFPATEAIEKDPLRARVLFVVLAEYGSNPQRRSLAHEYLMGLLDDLPNGKTLLHRLYLDSERYSEAGTLPPVVRYRLIDEALESGDLEIASRLMQGLVTPPQGTKRFEWDLRRARVGIFTGDTETGVRLVQQLLDSEQEWDAPQVDRLLQVIFDLQTVQYHQQALALFGALLEKPLKIQQQREILFWMADSLQALQRYDEAAYLYLKSATLSDPLAMDPWAQTARYRAAKALVEAGLLEDARQIYSNLLRATRDSGRKAVLQNDIQRLRLLRAAQKKTDG